MNDFKPGGYVGKPKPMMVPDGTEFKPVTGTWTQPCPGCGMVGPDQFGEQVRATGWHYSCALDFDHEQERDRDQNSA